MAKRKPKPLQHEDSGDYAELAGRPNPDGLAIVFTPSLAALFAHAEREKGKGLTPTETLRLRDRAAAIAVTAEQAAALAEDRGYDDVDPAQPHESWLLMNAD
jgi:hypothetical protein